MPAVTTTSTMQPSPRNKKMGPPTSGIAQPQNKRPSLRYSLNHLGKALADVVGKESKSVHVRSASAIPPSFGDRSGSSSPSTRPTTQLGLRRPSVAGAFERPSLDGNTIKAPQVRMRTMSAVGRGLPSTLKAAVTSSPKRASPKPSPPTSGGGAIAAASGIQPITRRRSFMTKGALALPTNASTTSLAAPVPVGTAKLTIRPKMSAPPRVTDDERPVEVKGREKDRRNESPRAPAVAAVGRTRERLDSRASPVRPGFPPAAKGRASPTRNDSTPTAPPRDDRDKRRERREKEKQAAEEKKEAIEREKKAAMERERLKVAEAKKESGHRTSGSTATLTSTSSIFTSISRSSTGDSHTSGGSNKAKPKSNTAVFPRAAQTVVLTPPDDEDEDEDTTIQTPMTRSRTATGSTQFEDVSSPAISRTLLASISAQTESPIMAPLDQRLRRAGSFTSMVSSLPSSTLPSPVHPGTVTFPPPAPGLATKHDISDDEDWNEEGDVSALLETVISPLKGATPAMPRFTSKSKRPIPETPSRPAGLPGRDALSYPSPAIPASVQRTRGDKVGKDRHGHRGPRESILSYDALVERSRLDSDDLEDMLRAPPPAVGLISPDMRPARGLPRLTNISPRRMNLGDSENEIEEEPEDQTVHAPSGQSISQVLFPIPSPAPREKHKLAEKEKAWTAKEQAWDQQRSEWETERAQWEAERAQWTAQQSQWNAQRQMWTAQQSEWTARFETERAAWSSKEHQLESTVQARLVDIEALEQEIGAHTAETRQRSEEHRLEVEALMKRVESLAVQSHELRAAKEREARFEARARCTSALNAWTGVCGGLKSDAASCAADRAALRVILLGLEAMRIE
ncbi:unnamed protein product [Rhizoctonia solani]|uniref:Uncharacterized protein n=1 Tax=Rhizoctonia solani TaxID=456999 RepID=A0A8H3DRF7_9AGAM|nr:unnamed protein product [Rhizoctonia solani]